MQQRWKWLLALAVFLLALSGTIPAAYAGVPDVTQSFFVPQSGSFTTPTEGAAAIANARRCPNTGSGDPLEGTQVLKLNARLKVVVKASDGSPISGIPASDICVLFNGGTTTQGFSGVGDDTIVANAQWNPAALCPDVRCIQADGPTDATGTAFITWIGAGGVNDKQRKWGAYSGDVPVMVLGFKLQGRLTSVPLAPLGSYTAHVKNLDSSPRYGLNVLNQGESILSADISAVQARQGTVVTSNPSDLTYQLDFDNNGIINSADLAFVKAHNGHRCNVPSF